MYALSVYSVQYYMYMQYFVFCILPYSLYCIFLYIISYPYREKDINNVRKIFSQIKFDIVCDKLLNYRKLFLFLFIYLSCSDYCIFGCDSAE